MLPAGDGTQLYWQVWRPDGPPRAVVLIVHGLKDHSERYATVAEGLTARGFAVASFDLRGHGRSEGRRAWVRRFGEYLDDLDRILGTVRQEYPTTPLFLFGHSMGGAIVTRFVLERHPAVHGFVLSAPALRPSASVSRVAIAFTKLLSVIAPGAAVFLAPNADFSRDPTVVAAMDQDPLIYQRPAPARTAAELLRTMDHIRSNLSGITTPFQVLHGTADRLSNPAGSQALRDGAASTDKTLRLYPGLYHDLLHEPEHATVVADATAWLEGHLPPR
ncbi:MAG: lysophospholipase, partial [Thermoplasmata archaeon]|nr:lysophospholipase [Thermoplasmata archaeon]